MSTHVRTGLIRVACLLAVLGGGFLGTSSAATVRVGVAANFRVPMEELARTFTQQTQHLPQLSFGSTGKLATQIRNGAPFEMLLSADQQTPAKLEADGFVVSGSRFTYATGKLVLWSAREGFVDSRGEILRGGHFRHLAMANPQLAPYGAAAQQVLSNLNLLATLQSKVVYGESIAQAHQFVFSGNAELGLVALSQVMHQGKVTSGSAWIVPLQLYDPVRQDLAILSKGRNNAAALALAAYLKSDDAKAIIQVYGYDN